MEFSEVLKKLETIRISSRFLRSADSDAKNAVLETAARFLGERQDEILRANAEDLRSLSGDRGAPAFRDRLTLNPARITQMIESLRQVAKLPDPVGEIVETQQLKNALRVRRVRAPLGVILMIFESRPNVAVEAFSLGFKAGNAMILRGGKESRQTTAVFYQILQDAIATQKIPDSILWGVTDPDRALSSFLLKQNRWIDVVVPRGGDALIEFVVQNSTLPMIKNDRGLCHIYLHEDADLAMAASIVENAKVQRPGVCNSMETLLVHRQVAASVLPSLHQRLSAQGVQWYGCAETLRLLSGHSSLTHASATIGNSLHAATSASWDTEYLDLKMNCRIVDSQQEAEEHIARHGSGHSEAIITSSREAATRFEREVDAAAVYWNASTRFTDGFELGLGGELGISTQKLHVRGPVGLRELTSLRWIIEGEGQIRN